MKLAGPFEVGNEPLTFEVEPCFMPYRLGVDFEMFNFGPEPWHQDLKPEWKICLRESIHPTGIGLPKG